jgi:hypothetical protein
MSERTAIDQIGLELAELAKAYAAKAEALASDPYFRDAVVKVSVSSFVWKLFDAYRGDERSLEVLRDELKEQCRVIEHNVSQMAGRNA